MFFGRSPHETGNEIPVQGLIETTNSLSIGSLAIGLENEHWVVPKPFQPWLVRSHYIQWSVWTAHDEPPVQGVARIESSIQEGVDHYYTWV